MEEQQPQDLTEERPGMSPLVWIILGLVILVVLGLVAWFFLSSGSSVIGAGSSSIPQPPALPN